MTNKGIKRYVALSEGNDAYKDRGTSRHVSFLNGNPDKGVDRIAIYGISVIGSGFSINNLGEITQNTNFIYDITNTTNQSVTISQVTISQQSNNITASVISQPSSVLAPGASTSFTISITPVSSGLFSFVVGITIGDKNISFVSSGTSISESDMVANAGILLWMNPEDDTLYTDAGIIEVDKNGGDQNAVRWVPGVKPSTLDYFEDSGADYAQWLPGASGINGNPVVHYTGTQALHDDVDAPAQTFRMSDIFDADSGVFVFAGKRTGTHATTDLKVIQDGMYLEMLSTASGGGTRLVMDMASDVILNTPPDGNGLLSVVVWLHGTDVDWWLNGTKQTQVTGVGTLSNLTHTSWSIRNFFDTTFMLLRHGAGKAVGATEADMSALAAYLETLLGR